MFTALLILKKDVVPHLTLEVPTVTLLILKSLMVSSEWPTTLGMKLLVYGGPTTDISSHHTNSSFWDVRTGEDLVQTMVH